MAFIIVTDINQMPQQVNCVSAHLPSATPTLYFHLNTLCGRPDLMGDALHNHLINQGGMNVAAEALRKHIQPNSIGLGYSAGGTALWRAVQAGMELAGLFCISSTRLRDQSALEIYTHVYFGEDDPNIPPKNWMLNTPTRHTVFQDAAHDFYDSTCPEIQNIITTDICAFQAVLETT